MKINIQVLKSQLRTGSGDDRINDMIIEGVNMLLRGEPVCPLMIDFLTDFGILGSPLDTDKPLNS